MVFVFAKPGNFCLGFSKSIAVGQSAAISDCSVHHLKYWTHLDDRKMFIKPRNLLFIDHREQTILRSRRSKLMRVLIG